MISQAPIFTTSLPPDNNRVGLSLVAIGLAVALFASKYILPGPEGASPTSPDIKQSGLCAGGAEIKDQEFNSLTDPYTGEELDPRVLTLFTQANIQGKGEYSLQDLPFDFYFEHIDTEIPPGYLVKDIDNVSDGVWTSTEGFNGSVYREDGLYRWNASAPSGHDVIFESRKTQQTVTPLRKQACRETLSSNQQKWYIRDVSPEITPTPAPYKK